MKGGNYLREESIQGRKVVSKKVSDGRKLFKGGKYTRADTIQGNIVILVHLTKLVVPWKWHLYVLSFLGFNFSRNEKILKKLSYLEVMAKLWI